MILGGDLLKPLRRCRASGPQAQAGLWRQDGHGLQIANVAIDCAKQIDDRGLVGGDGIEVTHDLP